MTTPSTTTARTAAEPIAAQVIHRLERQVSEIVRGKEEVIRLAVVCLLARGHVLIEDVPGVGKTLLARTLAASLGLSFQRIQFTSDLLPSDIVGVSVFRQNSQSFEFVPGPIFSNVVLADEINRASPKSQSALLEAMSERHVSIDRTTHVLPEPFIVLATQNPLEFVGTFPLPESQLDRFMMSLEMGYPPRQKESELLLSGGVEDPLRSLRPILGSEDLRRLQRHADDIQVAPKLADYLVAIATHTRESSEFLLGVSTRGVQSWLRASQAMALCENRGFVIPDDVQRLAPSVLAHRVMLKSGHGDLSAAREAIERAVAAVPVPI